MKKLMLLGAAVGIMTACAPTPKQVKEAVEKDPSIVFVAIEKDPVGFMKTLQEAGRNAQGKMAEMQREEEREARLVEFKNPLKPEIEETRAIKGNKSAPVTIVEYSDFQCPYCSRANITIGELEKIYGDKIRIVFKHLPLPNHPKAMPASQYFEAIAKQDSAKAYKFMDAVFEGQGELNTRGEAFLKETAKKIGADMARVAKDLKDPSIMERINKDMAEADKFGIQGTPGFVINGVSLKGNYPIEDFKDVIDTHLAKAK